MDQTFVAFCSIFCRYVGDSPRSARAKEARLRPKTDKGRYTPPSMGTPWDLRGMDTGGTVRVVRSSRASLFLFGSAGTVR